MARLFITPREMDFINDISKEIIKDVIGERIYYYSLDAVRSQVNDLYEESPEKVFDHPIIIDAMVVYEPNEIATNAFGLESSFNIEVHVQKRDMVDRGIEIKEGDFFSYGHVFFEVLQVRGSRNLYGQVEYEDGVKIVAKQARKTQFVSKVLGPTSENHSEPDAIKKTFYQQRGQEVNPEGPTGDIRALQSKQVLDAPLSVSLVTPTSGSGSFNRTPSFYDEP